MAYLSRWAPFWIFAFLATGYGFGQTPQNESEEHGPPVDSIINTDVYFSVLEPIPGLRAAVVTNGPIKQFSKLSDDTLKKRYVKFSEQLRDERRKRAGALDEAKIKEWKLELVETFFALRRRGIATPRQADETFAMALDSPSVADVVLADLSYIRAAQMSTNENQKGRVADKQTGLALGFMSTNATETSLQLGNEDVTPVKWSFRKATAEPLPDSGRVYQISLQVTPPNFGEFKTPFSQVIIDNGHLENRDWVYEVKPPKDFQEQKLLVSATLRSYESRESFNAGQVATTDSIDVPISQVMLKAKPSRAWVLIKETLKLLKQLFGILGGIPTIIVAWLAIPWFSGKKHRPRLPKRRISPAAV